MRTSILQCILHCSILVLIISGPAVAEQFDGLWPAHDRDVYGEPVHGMAMRGPARHEPGFQAFSYVNPDAPKGGRIRLGPTGSFDTVNMDSWRGSKAAGLNLVRDTLLVRAWDEPFAMYGLVARAFAMPEDRSSVTFFIDPRARFHDGSDVTLEDIVFSFKTLREHGHPNRRRFYDGVERVEIVDEADEIIRFHFAPGYDREMGLVLGGMPVLKKAYWQGRNFADTTLEPPETGGPYRIAEVEPGRAITYERVADYWAADLPVMRGQNNFDRIEYIYFRDNDVATEAFLAGNLDLRREWDPAQWSTAYAGPAVDDGRITRLEVEHGRPEWARSLVFNTRRAPFDDIRVREALGLAFDFEWMNRTLFGGIYQRSASYFANSELAASGLPQGLEREVLEGFADQLDSRVLNSVFMPPETDGSGPAGRRANLRKAMAMLREAGWRVEDGTLRHTETGRDFTFTILLADPKDERVALEFARALKRLGITARVRQVESAQFQKSLDEFDYDMVVWRWISSLSPGREQLNYWSSEAADREGSRNYAGVRDPVVDALAMSLAETRTREALVARNRALDRVLLWGHYSIPLFHTGVDYIAHWPNIACPEDGSIYGLVTESCWASPQHKTY